MRNFNSEVQVNASPIIPTHSPIIPTCEKLAKNEMGSPIIPTYSPIIPTFNSPIIPTC